jgi:hypothetical protein
MEEGMNQTERISFLKLTTDLLPPVSLILTMLGVLLSATVFKGVVRSEAFRLRNLKTGLRILVMFAFIVLLFLIAVVIRYWSSIKANEDIIYYGIGLFLAMCAGMFVRVIASNRQAGRPLFDVDASTLLFPLLFSLVVFYPIWSLAADAPRGLFPVHAAFLNGYFWESIVAGVKPPPTRSGNDDTPVE